MTIQPNIIITPNNLQDYINDFEINYETPKENFLGTFIARTLDLKLACINDNIPTEIKLEIGVDNETTIAQPAFIITDSKVNEDSGEVTLKGFDYSIKFDEYFDLDLTYPLTLRELANAISIAVDVDIKDLDFPNSNFIMDRAKVDEKFTYREIIGMIASAMGGIAFINNNNELEFKNLIETNFEIDNVFEQVIDVDKIGPINSVVLSREPIVDNIQLKNDESIEINGKTEIKIVNNWLIDDDREDVIQDIYNNLLNFEFYPADIITYQGYKVSPFDIVLVENKKVLITNLNIKYPLLLDGHIGNSQMTKTEVKYNTAKGLEKRIVDAEAEVDKIDGKITLIVSENIIRDADITNNKDNIDIVNGKLTQIQSTLDSISSTVKLIGGNNKQQNSVGAFGTNDYEQSDDGTILALETTELRNTTQSGRMIYISNNKWFKMKSDNLVIGDTYTLSFKYINDELNHCKISLINNNEITLVDINEKKSLTEVVYTFTALSNIVELYVQTSNYSMGITDYYLQTGTESTTWQPAQGEMQSTALEIYYNGIRVTSNNSEIITKINNLGFSVENVDGKVLITFNKDEAILADTNINGVLRQSRWKRQVLNVSNKEILVEVYE